MELGSDDVVLVTGGGSGMGEATARRCAALGAQVVLLDLPGSPGGEIAAEIGGTFCPADVRDEDQVSDAVREATQLGALRLAVCCAGVVNPGRILSRRGTLGLDAYRTVIEINLIGTFNVMRLAAEQMAENPPKDGDRGLIVMTASVAAFEGQIGQAAYASSKGGIVGLTLPAARDLARHGIRVMTIAPGIVDTAMMASLPEETKTGLASSVPHPARLADPDEYALLVEQIAANPYLNGEVIRLDGALRMGPG